MPRRTHGRSGAPKPKKVGQRYKRRAKNSAEFRRRESEIDSVFKHNGNQVA